MPPKKALRVPTTGEIIRSDGQPLAQYKSPGHAIRRKGGTGFITTYDPAVGEQIVDTVARGLPMTFAAQLNRVPQASVSNWLAWGEEHAESDPTDPRVQFAADFYEAQASFVQMCLDNIVDAGVSDAKQWTALMTSLERLHPEFFARLADKKGATNINVNVGIGLVEKKLHEMHAAGELNYEGG